MKFYLMYTLRHNIWVYGDIQTRKAGYGILSTETMRIHNISRDEVERMLKNGETIYGFEGIDIVNDTFDMIIASYDTTGSMYVLPCKVKGLFGEYQAFAYETNRSEGQYANNTGIDNVIVLAHDADYNVLGINRNEALIIGDMDRCKCMNREGLRFIGAEYKEVNEYENIEKSLRLMGFNAKVGYFGQLDIDLEENERFTVPAGIEYINRIVSSRNTSVHINKECKAVIHNALKVGDSEQIQLDSGVEDLEVIQSIGCNLASMKNEYKPGKRCKSLNRGAFICSRIKTVDFSESSIESIPYQAFKDSMIKKVNLCDIKEVHYQAFYQCEDLEEVTGTEELEFIGTSAFEMTGIKHIDLTYNTKTICERAFAGCLKLTRVGLGEGVTELGSSAFSQCSNLVYINTKNIVKIGNECFRHCVNIMELDLRNLEECGERAIADTNIFTLAIGEKLDNARIAKLISWAQIETLLLPKKHKEDEPMYRISNIGDIQYY